MKSGFASDGLPAYLAKFSLLTSIKGPPGSVIIDAYKGDTHSQSAINDMEELYYLQSIAPINSIWTFILQMIRSYLSFSSS